MVLLRLSLISGLTFFSTAEIATAAGVANGCADQDRISAIRSPVSENLREIHGGFIAEGQIRVVSASSHRDEWPVIFIESNETEDTFECYVVHNGQDANGFLDGFGLVRVSHLIQEFNEQTNTIELFIPVRPFKYAAGEEDYNYRLIEIHIGEDLVPQIKGSANQ